MKTETSSPHEVDEARRWSSHCELCYIDVPADPPARRSSRH
jgi:hypothetical protein